MKDMNELEKLLTTLVGELKPAHLEPVERVSTDPIYFDYTEKGNTRWLNLMADALKNAKTFEIHCWNEETEEIALALKYGKLKESAWTYGKIITGDVTPEFIEMILSHNAKYINTSTASSCNQGFIYLLGRKLDGFSSMYTAQVIDIVFI